jgi:hypothetical protein
VDLFHLPTFPDSEAFTEFVREAVITGSPTDRFETLEVNVQYLPERGYPCVTYHAVSDDHKVRVSFLFKKNLRFELFALYCQHPLKPGLGFSAVFADSIVGVSCGAAPMVNNCWAAQNAQDKRFRFQSRRPLPLIRVNRPRCDNLCDSYE